MQCRCMMQTQRLLAKNLNGIAKAIPGLPILQRFAISTAATADAGTTTASLDGGKDAVTDRRPRVIFSGIQPTGVPHLGNYLGALQQWKRLQDEATPDARLLFSIVDLHAITVLRERGLLRRWKRELLAALLAVGLDPARSIIFYQSTVPAHSELQWILSCTASVGYLSRMTQWKSKLSLADNANVLDERARARLKHGLFSYPILQAADILVHRATHVPVGEDQRQHLEFARECVTNFNHAYGPVLVAPETILAPARRVMSLQKPTQKMSKSDPDPRSRILLTDDADSIRRKVAGALTDSTNAVSYDPETRPGVANLLELLAHLDLDGGRGRRSPAQWAEELRDSGASLKALKEAVSDVVVAEVGAVRERYLDFVSRDQYLDEVLEEGARRARASAEETMVLVREAVELGF